MKGLFPPNDTEDIPPVPGLSYVRDYISVEEEKALVAAIDKMPWDTSWQRRRQPYGGAYGKGGSAPPLPPWGRELAERLRANAISDRQFDQMLVNEYAPGQGIAMHRDYEPYGRTVVSLSLISECVMNFRRRGAEHQETMLLEPRSLLILCDEARYDWEHGIRPRKKDVWRGRRIDRQRRLSVTFRFVDT